MYNYATCPVCKSTEFSEVLRAKDHTVSKEQFTIVHCANCSHRFTHPVPGPEDIGPYYQSEEYISHSNTSRGFINWAYQVVRKRTLKSKRKLVSNFSGKSTGKLLDLGAGTGAFLAEMQSAQWEATGIEPDPGARQVAQETWGLQLQTADGFYDLPENEFDVVTMWHVLEHVHDLDGYLKKIYAMLREGGKWIVAVPNYTSWDADKYQEMWAAYDVPRHLYHFSPASMKALVERGGFKLVGMKRMPFDSFYVSMLSERYKNGSMVKGIWNGFCSYISALNQKTRCSSLIYLIEK